MRSRVSPERGHVDEPRSGEARLRLHLSGLRIDGDVQLLVIDDIEDIAVEHLVVRLLAPRHGSSGVGVVRIERRVIEMRDRFDLRPFG